MSGQMIVEGDWLVSDYSALIGQPEKRVKRALQKEWFVHQLEAALAGERTKGEHIGDLARRIAAGKKDRRVWATSILRWYYAYRTGGLAALVDHDIGRPTR